MLRLGMAYCAAWEAATNVLLCLTGICVSVFPAKIMEASAIHGLHVGRPQVRTPSCGDFVLLCGPMVLLRKQLGAFG